MQQTEINSLMTQIFDLSIKITAVIFNTKAAKNTYQKMIVFSIDYLYFSFIYPPSNNKIVQAIIKDKQYNYNKKLTN